MGQSGFSVSGTVPVLAVLLLIAVVLGACSNETASQAGTGSVAVTLSDPPTCMPPNGEFVAVWVTITRVRAHISSNAGENDGGWVDLVDLTGNPRQVNLLGNSGTACILTTLGASSGLPPGNYQQIRLHLLSNDTNPSEGPASNACATTGGFNCVQLLDGTTRFLQLSSEAQTGIKIPPGRIAGGAISLQEGQSADINIDFSACNSVVLQGDGQFRLKPTLRAGEVSLTPSPISITGRLVDSTLDPPAPIANATIIVMAEQQEFDSEIGQTVDQVVQETLADPNDGTFVLCPLPMGDYDIVAAAISPSTAYNATVTFNVPAETNVGDIPLVPEGGSGMPALVQGLVTTQVQPGIATGGNVAMSALQSVDQNGSQVLVTVPLFPGSMANLATETASCLTATTGRKCANYTLVVPASNPSVGTFSSNGTATIYSAPAGPPVLYSVNARAFIIGSTEPNCVPSSLLTNVTIPPTLTLNGVNFDLTSCQAEPTP